MKNILIPDRPIAFNRDFVRLGLKVNGALFLSQCIYWSKRTKDPQGWFYKTVCDWEEETGLTEHEQKTVKNVLLELGIVDIEKRGIPARNFFKVNESVLLNCLVQSGGNHRTGEVEKPLHSITESTQRVPLKILKKESSSYLPDITIDEDIDMETGEPRRGSFGKRSDGKKDYKYETKYGDAVKRIVLGFQKLCERDLGTRPLINASWYKQVNRALSTGGLTESQIKKLLSEWLMTGLPEGQLMSLTRALSDNQINAFKVRHDV